MTDLFEKITTSQKTKDEIHKQKLIYATMDIINEKKDNKLIVFSVPKFMNGFHTTWDEINHVLGHISKGFNDEVTILELKYVYKGCCYMFFHPYDYEWYEYKEINFKYGENHNLFALKLNSSNCPEISGLTGKVDYDYIQELL